MVVVVVWNVDGIVVVVVVVAGRRMKIMEVNYSLSRTRRLLGRDWEVVFLLCRRRHRVSWIMFGKLSVVGR